MKRNSILILLAAACTAVSSIFPVQPSRDLFCRTGDTLTLSWTQDTSLELSVIGMSADKGRTWVTLCHHNLLRGTPGQQWVQEAYPLDRGAFIVIPARDTTTGMVAAGLRWVIPDSLEHAMAVSGTWQFKIFSFTNPDSAALFQGRIRIAARANSTSFRTAYAYDTLFAAYYQPNSERPDRVRWIDRAVGESGVKENLQIVAPIDSPMQWIREVHTDSHIAGISSIPLDTTLGSTRTIGEIAVLAVGYALGAVRDVMEGVSHNAFAAIRPPGHHVVNGGYTSGFCAYANVVIAARYAREVYGIKKILIVDWDYHYGNSTESFFCDDTNVFLAEFGSYGWESATCNSRKRHIVTYDVGSGTNSDYLPVLRDSVAAAMEQFKPELVLISCGFDLKGRDGLGNYHVTARGISELTHVLMDIAGKHCRGRVVSLLEGGYHDAGSSPLTYNGLAQCAVSHIRTLQTGSVQPESPFFAESSAANPARVSRTLRKGPEQAREFDLRGRTLERSGSRRHSSSEGLVLRQGPNGIMIGTASQRNQGRSGR